MVPQHDDSVGRIARLACALLCATLFGRVMLGQQTPDPSAAVSVQGQVVDALSGEPLRQVSVTLTVDATGAPTENRRYRPQRINTTTDAAGNFIFRNLPAGRYQLQGEKTGYVPAAFSDRAGQTRTLLHGEPGQQLTDIVFKLFPQAVISGQVLDEFGEPIAGAPVALLRQMDYFRRITERARGGDTNAVGEFLIGELRPGNYIVLAEPASTRSRRGAVPKQGQEEQATYVPTYYPGTPDPQAAAAIPLAAGQHVRGLDVWLQKGRLYQIRGRVEGLEPERGGFRVNLIPQDAIRRSSPRRPFQDLQNDRDGGFLISGVIPGEYQLFVSRILDNRPEVLASVSISVSNRDVDGLVLPAIPRGPVTISGRIRAETGSMNLEGAEVTLQRLGLPVPSVSGGTPIMPVEADGSFAIGNITPEKYWVDVSYPEGDTWYVKRITAGTTDVLRDGLDLTQSPAVAPLEIVISPEGGMIQGVVLEGELPRAGAYVTLFPETLTEADQASRRGANTDESGQFVIRNVTPGSYRLFAWEQRFAYRDLEEQDLRPYQASAVSVRVEENASKRVEVPLIPFP
jgi:protocatechuate 3,4-dioxygenase beta subunit